jgi:5-(carboxyamino)imidazole ribonucleotide mutase
MKAEGSRMKKSLDALGKIRKENKNAKERGAQHGSKKLNAVSGSSFRLPPSSLPLVAVVMGSKSDWETMRHTDETLTEFGVAHECRVVSAHRTPQLAAEFSSTAAARGIEVIIAAAGGAAHLAGVIAAHTILPVLGVPMKSDALNGMDSLLATVQMPAGIPVGTLAIGKPGAINAALFAIAILANRRPELRSKLEEFRKRQEQQVRSVTLP